MIKITKEVWVILSRDRKYIVKGVPRNRYLIKMDDTEDKKRILTYTTKKKAESAFKTSGFCGPYRGPPCWTELQDNVEAVKCELTLSEKE